MNDLDCKVGYIFHLIKSKQMRKPVEEMNKPELLMEISAHGWNIAQVEHSWVRGTHALRPGGWEVRAEPTPRRKALLTRFLSDIQDAELLDRYSPKS